MDATKQTLDLLPFWAPWAGPTAYLLVAFLGSHLISRITAALMLRPLRDCPVNPWTERARHAWAARWGITVTTMLLASGAGSMSPMFHGAVSPLPEPLMAALAGGFACIPGIAAARSLEYRLGFKVLSTRAWLRGCASYWLVVAPHLLVAVVAGILMPRRMSPLTAAGLLLTALLLWLCARGMGLRIARRIGLIRPASARVLGIVERTAARVGFGPRVSWEVAWDRPNAFAVHGAQAVMFTDGALRVLDDAELEAICAHEIGHLRETPGMRGIRSLATFLLFPLAALQPIVGLWGYRGLGAAFVVTLCAMVFFGKWSHRREHDADDAGCTGELEPGTYARALERIHEAALIPAVLGLESDTHPDLYDRMLAAGQQPAYPRPKRPPKARALFLAVAAPVWMIALMIALKVIPGAWHARDAKNPVPAIWSLSLGGGARELGGLARIRSAQGDREGTIRILAACCKLSQQDALYPAVLSHYLAQQERCDLAEAAVIDAEKRRERYGSTENEDEWIDLARKSLRLCRRRDSLRSGAPAN